MDINCHSRLHNVTIYHLIYQSDGCGDGMSAVMATKDMSDSGEMHISDGCDGGASAATTTKDISERQRRKICQSDSDET